MNTQLLTSIAIVTTLALVSSIPMFSQQAFADSPWKGCKPGSERFKKRDKNCRQRLGEGKEL